MARIGSSRPPQIAIGPPCPAIAGRDRFAPRAIRAAALPGCVATFDRPWRSTPSALRARSGSACSSANLSAQTDAGRRANIAPPDCSTKAKPSLQGGLRRGQNLRPSGNASAMSTAESNCRYCRPTLAARRAPCRWTQSMRLSVGPRMALAQALSRPPAAGSARPSLGAVGGQARRSSRYSASISLMRELRPNRHAECRRCIVVCVEAVSGEFAAQPVSRTRAALSEQAPSESSASTFRTTGSRCPGPSRTGTQRFSCRRASQ